MESESGCYVITDMETLRLTPQPLTLLDFAITAQYELNGATVYKCSLTSWQCGNSTRGIMSSWLSGSKQALELVS